MPLHLKGKRPEPGMVDRRYYMIDVSEGNRRVRLSAGTKDRDRALAKEQAILAALQNDPLVPERVLRSIARGELRAAQMASDAATRTTLSQAYDRALDDPRCWGPEQISRPDAILANRAVLERIIGKDFPILAITKEVLATTTKALLAGEDRKPAKRRSTATVNRKLDNLKRLLGFCKKWEIIQAVPDFESRFVERKGREWVMEDDAEEAIFKALLARDTKPAKAHGEHNRKRDAHHYMHLYIVLTETGLRHGEAFTLSWQHHVRLEQRIIQFRTRAEVKANASMRSIPITDRCHASLMVFKDVKVGPFKELNMRRAQTLWKEATRAAGIDHPDCVPHALRHTAGTRVQEVMGDIRLTQAWLGHADIKTSERYTKVVSRRMREAATKLGERSSSRHLVSEEGSPRDRDRPSSE